MTPEEAEQAARRWRLTEVLALGAGLLWQLYVAVTAFLRVPDFEKLFAGLGGPLPLVTRSLLATYRLWIVFPLLSAVLVADVLRRRNPSLRYFGLVLAAVLLTAMLLQAWLYEALYSPLFTILDQIG
jgi:hypothetical protein